MAADRRTLAPSTEAGPACVNTRPLAPGSSRSRPDAGEGYPARGLLDGGGRMMATGITQAARPRMQVALGRALQLRAPAGRRGCARSASGKKIRKTFAREAEAKTWRADALGERSQGRAEGTEADHGPRGMGGVAARGGGGDRPQPLRRPLQAIGAARLRAGDEAADPAGARRGPARRPARPDVQALVDRLLAEGLSPSTIRCTLLPLRAIFRRARQPRRARRQSLRRARAGRRSRQTRADRRPDRGRGPDRRRSRARPGALGDRDVRGAAPGRAAGAARRRRRPRRRGDPGRARLG